MRGKAHPDELRAKVVAEIASGEPMAEVARRHGVSKANASRWTARDGTVGTEQRTREAMAELIYDTITDLLTAVRAQLQATTRQEWLAQQTAGDVAELLGAELDRTVRLLAGFRPAEQPTEQPALDAATGSADAGDGVRG